MTKAYSSFLFAATIFVWYVLILCIQSLSIRTTHTHYQIYRKRYCSSCRMRRYNRHFRIYFSYLLKAPTTLFFFVLFHFFSLFSHELCAIVHFSLATIVDSPAIFDKWFIFRCLFIHLWYFQMHRSKAYIILMPWTMYLMCFIRSSAGWFVS